MVPKNASKDIKTAYDIANTHQWTKEELNVYRYWLREESSYNSALQDASDKSLQEGKKEGRTEALQEALKSLIDSGMGEEEAKKLLKI
ncbi:MAG: hypothetical protein COB02_02890 [Candidatus Cloacimonadota bacterium]|nr:MAG: hypothetical protein COB02_02890 [Candidatus Cloacimonadota bacterium]